MEVRLTEKIYDYCLKWSEKESPLLKELRRETFLKALSPHMISGPLQSQFLKFLVQLIKPRNVLEIGTFTGYATLYMASGLSSKGKVYTCEIDQELAFFHNKYFPVSGLSDRIEVIYGDANTFLTSTDLTFDFVFMDAGKRDYKDQLECLLEKISPNAVIAVDNVLWKEKVLGEDKDKMTQLIHEFNAYVNEHPALENFILPLRDGLQLIRLRS